MLSMTRWTPVDELTNLHRDLDRVFGRLWGDALSSEPRANGSTFLPASEMSSDDEAWYVRVVLPGIDPKEVQVEVTGTTLSVSGERRREANGARESLGEIPYGRFERRFTIPEQVDVDQVQASFRHGILELRLPVNEATKPRRIAIATDAKQIAA